MIIQQAFGKRVRFAGIENRVLKNMSPAELAAELDRCNKEIAQMRRNAMGQPRWYGSIPEIRKIRNVLSCERRRIERELSRRMPPANLPSDPIVASLRVPGPPLAS